jgi:ubiquinone/menaquinone biosynthesis C-methylase UbiE
MTTQATTGPWALGDYPRLAREVLAGLGASLVTACGVRPGQRVLDVAAGSGAAAIPAARAGAEVVATDLTPELLAAGRAEAEQEGLRLEWQQADAQDLPFADGEFDVVLSCIGAVFAADHRRTAGELVRVCRPGGTLGMVNWTPEGSIGEFFRVLGSHAPPPPGDSPLRWGDEEHVRELFGDRVASLRLEHRAHAVRCFGSPEEYRDYYAAHFGPVIAAFAAVADDAERTAALDRDFLQFAARTNRSAPGCPPSWAYEYLLVIAVRS